ncbi:hypothetical protein Q9Q94_10490 [Uliginosibacterium sp. 31-16]|uniref:hypothetical protein n=1 Tax=Uliginosibacterium sp. 31-16 TaxID=3068315 RepID=UPI00273EBFE8|nr:hypothetical protein [Uliginosibacterium sp. 31-16]MDP5239964.1 hypothetical protein [Uliginosibacterium sp. 31-16]
MLRVCLASGFLLAFLLQPLALYAQDDAQTLVRRYAPEAWQAQRIHRDVEVVTLGDGPSRAYVFIPQNPSPKAAPLVFFHHGWLGMNPKNFGGLIDLLVRRGAVVIFPVYQDGDDTPPQLVTTLAGQADAAALALLQTQRPGLVDTSKVLYLGFSMGASISLNLAIKPERFGLPEPRALLLIAPGDAHHVAKGPLARSILGPIEKLPAGLPTVMVSGYADTSIGVPTARSIAARLCHFPEQKRALLFFPSDSDEGVRIQAGHGSPGAPDSRYDFPDSRARVPAEIPGRREFETSPSLNLLDYYGYWRLATRLVDWVGGANYPAEIFDRSNPENRFLGIWPSGKPYAEALTEDHCQR